MDGVASHEFLMADVEPDRDCSAMLRQPATKKTEIFAMRKLIIATIALAFVSSSAFAQTSTAPATGGDSMSKGDTMKKTTKKKKSAKKTGDDDATKQ
jgi:hypothetical protein